MQDRGRRPPIDMRDLPDDSQQYAQQDPGGPRPSPGGLSYSNGGGGSHRRDPRDYPPQPTKGKSGGNSMNFPTALMGAILGIIGSVFVFFSMGASKADLQALEAKINTVQTNVTTQESRITAITGSNYVRAETLNNYATLASLSNYATKAEISSLAKPDMSAYYTKDQVDASFVKKGTTGTVSTGTTGTTTTTGSYTVTMDKNQIISTATDTGNKDVTITVVNSSGAGGSPTFIFTLRPVSPTAYDTAKITTYTAYSTLSGWTTAVAGTKQSLSDVPTLIEKVFWVAPSFYMDNGASKTIWLHFDVKTTDVVTWTLSVQVLN